MAQLCRILQHKQSSLSFAEKSKGVPVLFLTFLIKTLYWFSSRGREWDCKYKFCFHFHYTPVLWRLTNFVFIPKPGKNTYLLAKSFQSICLSDYFFKGLERLAVWRMEKLWEFPVHPRQHSFQKGRGTESTISIVVDYIEKLLFFLCNIVWELFGHLFCLTFYF